MYKRNICHPFVINGYGTVLKCVIFVIIIICFTYSKYKMQTCFQIIHKK
jgi:hypothetical protein